MTETEREYEGNGITVLWRPSRCIHSGNCARGLPAVFRPAERPWVDAAAAQAVEVARVIEACPSGALGYRRSPQPE